MLLNREIIYHSKHTLYINEAQLLSTFSRIKRLDNVKQSFWIMFAVKSLTSCFMFKQVIVCSVVLWSFTTRVGEQVCYSTYIKSYTSKTEPIILDMVCSKSMQV